MKENLRFKQSQLSNISNQIKTNKKQHIRWVISSIRVGAITKTDDEIYVLSTIKIYNLLFICFLC